MIFVESKILFDYRALPQYVAVTSRPPHDAPDALEVELRPAWEKLRLSGYLLQATSEVEIAVRIPPELACADLGNKISIRIVAHDFNFALHQTQSRWKDASKLVQQNCMEFFSRVIAISFY